MFCKKDVLPKLFMIFITLKTSDKKCLKIEKAWFLLVHWVVKNNRLILLCHFHLSMSFFAIFQRKRQFEKHAICLVKLLFTCQPRNRVFIFFFYFFLVTLPGLIDTLAQLLALRSMLCLFMTWRRRYLPQSNFLSITSLA